MTDGIIQQVFKSWEMECIHGNKNTIGYLTHDQIRKREKKIMQELIEKIKQEVDSFDNWQNVWYIGNKRVYSIELILQKLIGDNKE